MLKAHIEQSGIPRTTWCNRFGISKSYLSLLENGQKSPSLALAVLIERKTKGAVPATSWIPDPKKEPRPGADERGESAA